MELPPVLVFSTAWGQSSDHIGSAHAWQPLSLHWGRLPAPTGLPPGLALVGVARDPQCLGDPCAWLLADSLLGHGLWLGLGACCPGPLPPSVGWPVPSGRPPRCIPSATFLSIDTLLCHVLASLFPVKRGGGPQSGGWRLRLAPNFLRGAGGRLSGGTSATRGAL